MSLENMIKFVMSSQMHFDYCFLSIKIFTPLGTL